jgi:archaellum component FlaF (FlaF/FlaG flagellin family)
MSRQEYTSVLLIAAILFTGILVASLFSAVAQEQQQQPQNTTTRTITASAGNTTTSSAAAPSSGIQLSPQPIYQERVPPGSVTPINQTHIAVTHTGNGTLTIPNSNQTINVISNGTAIASLAIPSAIAKETIRAPNGETVTITFYEIIQFSNPAEAPLGGGKGFKIIKFHTNSTGMLAPLNGVIAAGINDIQPNGHSELTAWRWESGISIPTMTSAITPTLEDSSAPPPSMETPTAEDLTADDSTATTTTTTTTTTIPIPEEEVEGQ